MINNFAKEVRELQNKANGNEEELLKIQEQIKKEVENKHSLGFITIGDISNASLQILGKLGYHTQLQYDQKEGRMYYIISWIPRWE